MDKKMKITVIGASVAVLIILMLLGSAIVKMLTPSDEVMPLTDYYQVGDSEVMVILQDEIYGKRGLLIDGTVYLDYDTVTEKFNHRFYWDQNENVLTYTTPTEIIRAEAGSSDYSSTMTFNTTMKKTEYQIVRVSADKVYIALGFVGQYSDITFRYYGEPNRVIIDYRWGEQLYTEVTKATQLRYEPNIKSPILKEMPKGTGLMYVSKEEAPRNGFFKVMTEEGIIGYVKNKHVKESFYKAISSSFKAPEYTAQTRAGMINLVFHQVFNSDAAGNLEELIHATKGVTVVSPTWFNVLDASGAISSFASEDYVDKAKGLGLEVWALVTDVNIEVDMLQMLSHTSARDNLSNALVQAALDYKLNGINVDLEKISKAGPHYIQFLRELSVKCRNNGIVLSVDDFVPASYNEFYDMEEQGKILDYVIIMAYNESTGAPGPVSSIHFVKKAVEDTLKEVPEEKTIIAIPFYTKLWKEDGDGKVSADDLAMTNAAQTLVDNGAEVNWDGTAGCNYAEYEKDGATYKMWQEEDKSIEEKMKVIYEAEAAGVAAWKLGLESESVWDVIIKYLN